MTRIGLVMFAVAVLSGFKTPGLADITRQAEAGQSAAVGIPAS